MTDNILHLKGDTFDKEVMESKIPVIVDFWASWCHPCMMVAPILEELSMNYAGRVKVAKVEVDEAAEISSRFNVMNIPTLIIFSDGKEMDRIIGVNSKDEITRRLEKILKG